MIPTTASVILSEALQRNAKYEAWLSNISKLSRYKHLRAA